MGRRARPAPELQDAHALLRLQQEIFHLVVVAEGRAREHARAVVHVDVAVGAEYIVISSVFVVVLEKVLLTRRPLDELAPLEFVEPEAVVAGVLRMGHEEKENVMKDEVGCEQPSGDPYRPHEYRNRVHEQLL